MRLSMSESLSMLPASLGSDSTKVLNRNSYKDLYCSEVVSFTALSKYCTKSSAPALSKLQKSIVVVDLFHFLLDVGNGKLNPLFEGNATNALCVHQLEHL